jgi:hypothetical protein
MNRLDIMLAAAVAIIDGGQHGLRQNGDADGDADRPRAGGRRGARRLSRPDGAVWFTAQSAGKLGGSIPEPASRISSRWGRVRRPTAYRPEVTKRLDLAHKRTNHELRRPCEGHRAPF